MDPRGRFIVIEGTDGSGKTVQFERLVLALPEGAKVGTLDFPQYSEPSSYFVQKYLTGKYGGEVGPYAASVFYAVDRFDAKLKTFQWLAEGRTVIANRYVASNMAHQGAKIEKKNEREKFYRWLYDLEYGMFGIPKPDLNIVLHVPAEISYELIAKKNAREYLSGKKRDLHEADFIRLKRAEEVYLEVAALFPGDFKVVGCAENGVMLPPEKVHEKVWAIARPLLGM
jgi:dTMP kinase